MNAVEATDLALAYGRTPALSPSSFSIPAGRVTAIIGPNGSGKSTLLSAIAGLHPPSAGSVSVAAARDHIAFVLQGTKVNEGLPISVAEVVMMGRYPGKGPYRWIRRRDRDAVAEAMDRLGITDLASHQLHQLSGGQRQRVFVAQGLAQEHDLLLLDEPLTGIDLPTAQAIDEVIHDETERGCTVVMSTHDLSEAQEADFVILLSRRVVASGVPGDVLTAANLKEAYGASLLHVEGDRVFLDDPAHAERGRHLHRDRSSEGRGDT